MKFEELELTPETASMLLESQAPNRTLSKPAVNKMVADILGGRYQRNPNPICIDRNGIMIDGQHRCAACVESHTPIPVVIAWDCDPDVVHVLDGGRTRSAGDVIRITAPTVTNVNTKTAAATAVLKYEWHRDRVWTSTMSVTRQMIEQEVLNNADLYAIASAWAERIGAAIGRSGKLATRGALTTLFVLVSRYSPNEEQLDAFGDGMADPVTHCGGNPYDPRNTYREQPRGAVFGGGQSSVIAAILAWNAYVQGRDLKVIIPRRTSIPMPRIA